MTKRRNQDNEEEIESIPLPIQTFLWRQTSPFIRPKFGKQQDALAMEQREACKSFEKVLVQNIQFGLSPSLTDAIKSISRWKLVQASLPHVMHCGAALLYNRKNSNLDKLGAAETKLLYTLHWIVLDAAEECADAEAEQGIKRPMDHFLLPITTIELFIYLYSPLISYLKNSDSLMSFRLENGRKLWSPLFKYQHPDIPSFTAHVKPKRTILRASRYETRVTPKFGDVFIGAGAIDNELDENEPGKTISTSPVQKVKKVQSKDPVSLKSDDIDRREDDFGDGHADVLCEVECKSLAEPMMATYLDVATLRCLFTSQWLEEGIHWSLNFLVKRLKSIQDKINETDSQRPRSSSLPVQSINLFSHGADSSSIRLETNGPSYDQRLFPQSSSMNPSSRTSSMQDLRRSSFCGSNSKWTDNGGSRGGNTRQGSKRFKIRDLMGGGSSSGSKHDPTPTPTPITAKSTSETHTSAHHSSKPGNSSSFRTPIGDHHHQAMPYSSNLFTSVSFRARPNHHQRHDSSHQRSKGPPPRPRSALGVREQLGLTHSSSSSNLNSKEQSTWSRIKFELIRGKSMPSLHIGDPERQATSDKTLIERVFRTSDPKLSASILSSKKNSTPDAAQTAIINTCPVVNPIITVTEHSPVASVQFFLNQEDPDSSRDLDILTSSGMNLQQQQFSSSSVSSTHHQRQMFIPPCRQYTITRSQTDSNINYYCDTQTEAPGSVHYVTKSGHLSALVILKAIHSVSLRDNVCSFRVCEEIISVLDSILSLGFLRYLNSPEPPDIFTSSTEVSSNTAQKMRFNKNEELSMYTIFLNTLVKVCRHMGCPHSCNGGHQNPHSEVTRKSIVEMLNLLYRANEGEFIDYFREMIERRSMQEIVDTFHAFLGFCGSRSSRNSPGTRLNGHFNYVNDFGSGLARQLEQKGVEAVIIGCIFDPIISRLVKNEKELRSQENLSLYCDVRQLISYVRDNHGGTFRRVALSGLLESLELITRMDKQQQIAASRSTKGAQNSGTAEAEQEQDIRNAYSPSPFIYGASDGDNKLSSETEKGSTHRKSFFRKKISGSGMKKAPSSQSICDDFPTAWPVTGGSSNALSLSSTNMPGGFPSTPAMMRKNRSCLPRLSMTDDDISISPRPGKFGGSIENKPDFNLVSWLKGKQSQSALADNFQQSGDPMNAAGTFPSALQQDTLLVDGARSSNDRINRRPSFQNRTSTKPMTKSAPSQVSSTFSKAKKRVEDQFKNVFGKGKSKQSAFESENVDLKRKDSYGELDHGIRPEESNLLLRETKLVCIPAIRNGMIKFSFLLESCSPGSFPDPPLIAAILDINAPVIARASFFLECAHFVHRCSKGMWPSWMKLNFPMFRPSGPFKSGSGSCIRGRASQVLHRNAGRMFYLWAEAIGAHIDELIYNEKNRRDTSSASTSTNAVPAVASGNEDNNSNKQQPKQKGIRSDEDGEDFLDEATINPAGNECPFPLKVAACHLLLEITAFLRETHQYLPTRASKSSIRGGGFEKPTAAEPKAMTANRRWSMALSSLGFSQTSAHSLMSLAEQNSGPPTHAGERRISFVLHEADGENNSEHSSNTTDTGRGEEAHAQTEDHKKMMKRPSQCAGTPARPHLLRRATGTSNSPHSGSFKRRSIKLKKNQDRRTRHRTSSTVVPEDDEDERHLIRRADSLRSRRKVSGISEKSDTSERADVSGEESPGVLSDDGQNDTNNDILNADDSEIVRNMPWLRVIISLMDTLDYECSHKPYCQTNCYRRQIRSCTRLVKVIKRVYEEPNDAEIIQSITKMMDDKEDALKKEKKFKKIITGPSSPIRRKTSYGANMDRLDKEVYMKSHSLHSSTGYLSHYDVEAGSSMSELTGKRLFGPITNASGTNRLLIPKSEPTPNLKFLDHQVKGLFHSPLSALVKGFFNLSSSSINSVLSLSWKLLLEPDQNLSSSCATAFIVCSVKSPERATKILNDELMSEDPLNRMKAVNKFYSLWRARYQCWQRMEEGAHLSFKVPPPMIDFTLPSPKIAMPIHPLVDPPWMPPTKSKVEEVTINQEQAVQKSFVTATKTRRKQQIELVNKALQDEEAKLREERETYRISGVPINNEAAYEPALFRADEPEEGDEETAVEKPTSQHKQVTQAIFPSCLCSAAITIINMLDDPRVTPSGNATYEVAYKVVWNCLVEDTSLFLRHLFEKLTRESQQTIFQILRRLIRFMPRLPAQAAFSLYNYLIGFIMFNVRTPVDGSQEMISTTLSVLWLVIPSVHGLFLKDLKQVLRKEQCDATLLITANVPSAKKVIIHSNDAATIPSQFPIHEDTQFYQVLVDCLESMNIDSSLINEYFLVDTKTNQMHNLNAYVRDFYFFKRSQYPQLSLVRMDPAEAYLKLQQQAFKLQFLELGKVLMTLSIIKSDYIAIQRVLFLHDELMKLPSFPRKALEANFNLYRGPMGKEVLGMDTLHKVVWVKLVSRMLEVTQGFFAQSSEIHLFLNVVNGSLVLHCEDAAVLRLSMATFLNAAHQFRNIFSANGYLLIMPTLLRIYSNHQTNGLLCRTIEFVCKQFYILHRKPFILQMFGSAASILDIDSTKSIGDATKIQPKAFFQLLQSLGQYIVDPLDILELVDAEKPLKALDFCYQMDPEALTILDAVSLCVTVAAYAPDSQRGHQMLTILETILPLFMKHMQTLTMKKETPGGSKNELQMIHNISVCIKTLIRNCEALTRNFAGPQRAIDLRGSSIKNASRGAYSPPIEIDEDSHSNILTDLPAFSRFMGDSYFPTRSRQQHGDEDTELIRAEFRKPRDILLNLVAEFLTRSTLRLADLSKKVPDLHGKNSSYELLDVKCHLRLAEIAHSLLKVAPFDPQTMASRGLVRYMNEILPNSEWRQEAMRPALIMILRRLDKMFNKIAKQGAIKRLTDWEAAKRLLKGVYSTFVKHPYIVHLPHLKSLINICQGIILGDSSGSLTGDNVPAQSSWAAVLAQSPPPGFSSVAVRLIAMQLLQLGETQTLETLCGNAFLSPEKTEIYFLNMIYPMCIRISGGMNSAPKLRSCDITFILSVILNSLSPSSSKTSKSSESSNASNAGIFLSSLQQIGLLGLKIMMVCFERQLSNDWYRIARCIRENANRNLQGVNFWNFIDFVVTHRTPLFILLLPLVRYKLMQKTCENDQEYYYQHLIRCKLEGQNMPLCRSRGQLLLHLFAELRGLKDDLIAQKRGNEEKSKPAYGFPHRPSFTISSAPPSGASKEKEKTSSSQIHSEDPSDATEDQSVPKRPSLLRGLSFRVDRVALNRGTSVKLPEPSQKPSSKPVRRTSYPSSGEDKESEKKPEPSRADTQSHSEPRLFRRSASAFLKGSRRNKLRVSQNSMEENAGRLDIEQGSSEDFDPSLLPECPEAGEDFDRTSRHRLQRQKAQSRKTFRFRRSRKGDYNTQNEPDDSDQSPSGCREVLDAKNLEKTCQKVLRRGKSEETTSKSLNSPQESAENSTHKSKLFTIQTDSLPV
ncbi:unc80, NALCN channel complex subunit [Brevipalpus obovatus]|uniref:unc80, NALCN channel complex subunit n=1 Tax=Brevipalpus obovatus TaxID=246614 RepID=UPI003D9ECBA9